MDQARKELIDLKGVAYPEIDLAHIFNQLYVDARPQSSSSNQPEDWGQLIAMVFRVLSRKHVTAYPHTKEVLAFLKEQAVGFISCLMLKQPLLTLRLT